MKWIPIEERMPEPEEPVLVTVKETTSYGVIFRTVLKAEYIPAYTVEHSGDDENYDYDEKNDNYYVKQGWYERNWYSEENYSISGEVIAWMPLPEPYREGKQ